MAEKFDAIVLGMGPGGELAAGRLVKGGLKIALIERELIGGECAYWACIPSKTLLRPPEAKNGAARAAGVSTPELEWADTVAYRDYMIRHLDDSNQIKSWESSGATVFKGVGRITGPGMVEVDGRALEAKEIVVATGSDVAMPSIEGLDGVTVWTNREATTLKEVPRRALLVGGSAVGIELAQMLSRFGSQVTLVQRGDRLIDREDPRVGELIQGVLKEEGIDVHTGRTVKKVGRAATGTVAELDDGSTIETDVIVIGTGRVPRVEGLGLEAAGIKPDVRGLAVNEHCQVADGVWALGDVTGVQLFTHVAMYQGRVVADNILGHTRRADYRGIPRVVFSDPEIAAVGMTERQARQAGIQLASTVVNLAETIARPWTYEKEPRGELGLLADLDRKVLVGAWAVAPLASEWIHSAALAIRAQLPLDVLLDGVAQFPTYSEAYLAGLEQLTR